MLTLIGQTIYYDSQPVAWLTIPNGTLRGSVKQALGDLPDVTPLREAIEAINQAEGTTKTLYMTAALVDAVGAWLESLKDTNTPGLL